MTKPTKNENSLARTVFPPLAFVCETALPGPTVVSKDTRRAEADLVVVRPRGRSYNSWADQGEALPCGVI